MDLDWTLIEYRPGRYAKVASDGTFLGTATEAETRAWFAASAQPNGQEAAPPSQDAGPTATPAPAGPAGPGAHAGSLEPGKAAEPAEVAPEPSEDWEKPLIWAPPRPAHERQARRPAARTPEPEADEPDSEPPRREIRATQPEDEVTWAKPMLWGRPPADPRRRESSPEPPSLTAEPETTAPGAASSNAVRPDPEPTSHQADQDRAAPEGLASEFAAEPKAEPAAGDKIATADADGLESASPTMPAGSTEPEPVQVQMGFALTEPADPSTRGPEAVQVAMDLTGLAPFTPDSPEPPPEPEPGPVEVEPRATGPEPAGTDTGETVTKTEDLDKAPDILAVEPELPESEPEPAQEVAATLAPEPVEAEEIGQEPEELDEAREIVVVEPDHPELEAKSGREDPATLAIEPLDDVETALQDGNDIPVIASAAKHRHESSRWQSPRTREKPTARRKGGLLRRSAPRNDMRHDPEEVLAPEPIDAEEDWLEAEIPEGEIDAAPLLQNETDAEPLDTEEDEFAAEPGVLGPPPTHAPGAVPLGAGLDTDEPGPLAEDLDLETPDAGDLWLWVDPRYEAGYSPATFDLAAFLQRATALFQSKAWTGGRKPGRIAVHSDDAAQGLEAVAERLGLVVVEDARVSGGTYWLGLGTDGEPAETHST